jgi:hypothetical protein
MTELDRRLESVAHLLDAAAPAFDAAALASPPRRPWRRTVVLAVGVLALVATAAAPATVSMLRDVFQVESVAELGPAPTVAPPFAGRQVATDSLGGAVPFRVRSIASLGAPQAAYARDDVAGGMATLVYGPKLLTQWRVVDVQAGVEIVPASGTAEDVTVGAERLPALWIEGAARGTFTVVGADGAVHHERFEIGDGALVWRDGAMAFLLQGTGSRAEAIDLAAQVDH